MSCLNLIIIVLRECLDAKPAALSACEFVCDCVRMSLYVFCSVYLLLSYRYLCRDCLDCEHRRPYAFVLQLSLYCIVGMSKELMLPHRIRKNCIAHIEHKQIERKKNLCIPHVLEASLGRHYLTMVCINRTGIIGFILCIPLFAHGIANSVEIERQSTADRPD